MIPSFSFLRHVRPFVRNHHETRSMHFSADAIQSLMSCQRPYDLEVPYTKTMMGFLLAIPEPTHVLMIGLGGGSLAKFCHQHFPKTRMTVVEINPHVIAMRKQFLIPDDDERFNVVCADGAEFVRDAGSEFDVVLNDGFDAQGQSAQLCSREFYENCCRSMTPKGVLVANLDKAHPANPQCIDRICQTYKGNAVTIEIADRDNSVIFAGKNIPISVREMSLSWTLGHHVNEVRTQLKAEFQRIIEHLDTLEPLGQEPVQHSPQL